MEEIQENDPQLDTETNDLDNKRKQQRISCTDQERDAIRTMLLDEMTAAYFMWWMSVRKNSAPLWFRQQWEEGARLPGDFDCPAEVLRGSSPK